MHQDNKIRNPHEKKEPTKRAQIILLFDVPRAEATENWLNAVVGVIRREVAVGLGKSARVEGKWL